MAIGPSDNFSNLNSAKSSKYRSDIEMINK